MKWKWQRVTRGWSDYDWWSFDQYLARVIADGCQKFRYDGAGMPSELSDDEWLEILTKIEDGFRNYTTVLDASYDDEQKICDEMREAGELLIKWFPALWD